MTSFDIAGGRSYWMDLPGHKNSSHVTNLLQTCCWWLKLKSFELSVIWDAMTIMRRRWNVRMLERGFVVHQTNRENKTKTQQYNQQCLFLGIQPFLYL